MTDSSAAFAARRPYSALSLSLACALLGPAAVPLSAQELVISEFLASNAGGLQDEDGDSSDWIEIHNRAPTAVDLAGWALTDDNRLLFKWVFAQTVLQAGGYLVVFASGKDRSAAGGELHTNFRLDRDPEFLALVRPDGSIAHAYAPAYPRQREDISYGLAGEQAALVDAGTPYDYLVPTSGSLGLSWTSPGFAPDPAWRSGEGPIGFDAGGGAGTYPEPVSYWSFDGTVDDVLGRNAATYAGEGAPAYVKGFEGLPNGALRFDGSSDHIAIEHEVGLPIYSHPAYTVAMWVRGEPQPDKRVYSEGSSANNSPLFTIGTDRSGGSGAVDIFIRTANGFTVVNHALSAGTAFDGTWHHIAWVDRNGDAALYIDGVRDPANFSYAKPDLPLDVSSIGAVLRASACCYFTGEIDDVALWDTALEPEEIAALAAGASPLGGSPYRSIIRTDIEDEIAPPRTSVYLRYPFAVSNPGRFDSLTLRVRYDDGFAAYLNGVEVARRNAGGTLGWSSVALSERTQQEAVLPETIDLSEFRDLLVEGANVLAVHLLNASPDDLDLLFSAELTAGSSELESFRYFKTPTPGAPNTGGVLDFVEDTRFSVDRGFYDAPITVAITTDTPGAVIRYTTDQSWPSETHGEIYTGPIRIDRTTTLRAAAFKEGYEPSNVDTHTYIFLDDVIRQPRRPPGYPSSWAGWPADYEMDPEIALDPTSPHYAPTLKEDLKTLPVLSLTVDRDDLMGPTRGIYTHSLSRGRAWERPASMELIFPDDPGESFGVNCGVRIHGFSSARPGEGKFPFRVLFKSQYGPSKLRYRLFPDSPVDRFDTLVLRSFSTDSWHFKDGGSRYRRWDSQFIRDIWMRDTQLAMGHVSSHSVYVHLFLNGMYWGIYNPSERPDDDFQASYLGGDEEEWDIVKDFNELFRGRRAAWDALMQQARSGLGSTAAYQRVQGNNPDGTPNPSYPVLLDTDNLIDYMLLHIYAGAEDWPHHNWYAARNRTGSSGGWKFYVWDQEIVLDFAFRNRVDVSNDNSPAIVYASLRANPEFRMRFADRVHLHLFNGGVLTDEAARARWMRRAREIDRAVVAESARWGDYRMDVPDPSNSPAELYTREDHWLVEQRKVLEQYIPESRRLAIERFRSRGLYPEIDAPAFNRHGGVVEPGFEVSISAPAGTIYYTLDGTDPRLPGGEVSPDARIAGAGSRLALLPSGAPARASVPRDGSLGLRWTAPDFDDSSWIAGTTGVGYERTSGYEDLIGTDLLAVMDGINATAYIRIPFEVEDPGALRDLVLRMKYDDGFIAYLNGVRVAERNAPADPQWDSEATQPHSDASAAVFEDIDISAFLGELRPGRNVLAVHGLNSSPTSSDFLILPEVASTLDSGSAITIEEPTVVKTRAFDGEWSALTEAFFYFDIPLRITEVMYHPPPPPPGSVWEDDDFEFVEFQNVGDSALSLDGITLEGGISFDFSAGEVRTLQPGEIVLIVRNIRAFGERYGLGRFLIAGEYDGRLSNRTDRLDLRGPYGEPILDFAYEDRWYPETDGSGRSLVIRNPRGERAEWTVSAGWRPSDRDLGTPGEDEAGIAEGGLQLAGNINQDGALDISDAVRMLLFLFSNPGISLPCEGGIEPGSPNHTLLDLNADGGFDLTDPLYLLNHLFRSGPPPALGTGCVRIRGCPDACPR